MTLVEEKTKEALEALGIGIKREVTLKELEFSFMGLERRYSPEYTLDEKYKDGIYFNKLKAHFEYVASDICRTNEAIRNILDPDNKTYEYQEKPIDILNDSVSYPNNYNYDELNDMGEQKPTYNPNIHYDYKELDKVQISTVICIFLFPIYGLIIFFMLKKLKPKASKWYLLWTIVAFLVNLVIQYYLIESGYMDSIYGSQA